MADHVWEDEVEPAMEAAEWVLERLFDTFQSLVDDELEEHGEFEIAAKEVRKLITQLQDVRNDCYNRRDGEVVASEEEKEGDLFDYCHDLVEEAAQVDVPKIMKETGLKDVDGIHYNEEAYTGARGTAFRGRQHDISDFLEGKEKWEDVLLRVNTELTHYVVKEKEPNPGRLQGKEYTFLYYNPHWNLMSCMALLDEKRKDVEGKELRLRVEWTGLRSSPTPGFLSIYELMGARETLIASASCTHFSQLIKVLEAVPAIIDQKSISDVLHKVKK